MTKDEKRVQPTADRRGFLKMIGFGAVGTGAAAASAVAGTSEAEAKPRTDGGYQETEHVKTYYDLARF